MKDHLSNSTESHLTALCELVYAQKKQLENQKERIQLQKEHIQLQKETLLLQKRELIDVRSRTANGEFIWRIPDFTRKLMDAKSGRAPEPMISEPFYTHPHGYKMCAGLWLNGVGTGRGRYISVGLQVSLDKKYFRETSNTENNEIPFFSLLNLSAVVSGKAFQLESSPRG